MARPTNAAVAARKAAESLNEPDSKAPAIPGDAEVRPDLSESRELPVVPSEPETLADEAVDAECEKVAELEAEPMAGTMAWAVKYFAV